MKRSPSLLRILLAGGAGAACLALPSPLPGLFPTRALAQVSTNTDALPEAESPSPAPATRSARHAPLPPTRHASPVSHTSAASRVGTPPDVPPAPPVPVVIAPPGVAVQKHPPVPPTPIQPVDKAQGDVMPRPDGLRLTFGPGTADLNRASLDALTAEARRLAGRPQERVTLLSYAAGNADDLSSPRRVALARALTVRAVLINNGVVTTRIYPRAIGLPDVAGTDPADRLDLIASGAVSSSPGQAAFGTSAAAPSSPHPASPQKATP